MRYLMGLVVATGLWQGLAGEAQAQFSLSIGGNPYYGSGLSINSSPYGVGYANYGLYGGPSYYNSGYIGAPGAFAYSSGYQGYNPVNLNGYGTGYRPYYGGVGYSNYGYGVRSYGYGYGGRNGFGPFRGGRRFYR